MIIIVHSWTCTLCDHGRTFDPAVTEPPEICPACNNGQGISFQTQQDCDDDFTNEDFAAYMEQDNTWGK